MKTGKCSLDFVGIGLYGCRGLTLGAREAMVEADVIFAEFYTSYAGPQVLSELEEMTSRRITLLGRKEVENAEEILSRAASIRVVLLTGGDAMSATTHVELRMEALRRGIPSRLFHAPSVLTAVPSELGLSHYKFGRVTTLVFPRRNFFPESPYDVIGSNMDVGLHTLILLDIVSSAETEEGMIECGMRGSNAGVGDGQLVMMTSREGVKLLTLLEKKRGRGIITPDLLICSVARAGSEDVAVRCGRLEEMIHVDMGGPPHSLVVPADLHFMEAKALSELAGAPDDISKRHRR